MATKGVLCSRFTERTPDFCPVAAAWSRLCLPGALGTDPTPPGPQGQACAEEGICFPAGSAVAPAAIRGRLGFAHQGRRAFPRASPGLRRPEHPQPAPIPLGCAGLPWGRGPGPSSSTWAALWGWGSASRGCSWLLWWAERCRFRAGHQPCGCLQEEASILQKNLHNFPRWFAGGGGEADPRGLHPQPPPLGAPFPEK